MLARSPIEHGMRPDSAHRSSACASGAATRECTGVPGPGARTTLGLSLFSVRLRTATRERTGVLGPGARMTRDLHGCPRPWHQDDQGFARVSPSPASGATALQRELMSDQGFARVSPSLAPRLTRALHGCPRPWHPQCPMSRHFRPSTAFDRCPGTRALGRCCVVSHQHACAENRTALTAWTVPGVAVSGVRCPGTRTQV